MTKLTEPKQIVEEFQKRQKRIVLVGMIGFAVMVPIIIYLRSISPMYALYGLAGFIVPFVVFYLFTFRCPACGVLVSQRRRLHRMPIVCNICRAVLDPQ